MRYVDLMGGTKPHLLVKTVNNLGAETRVDYAPSTKFYLQDKRAGTPWITRLPFPVHVVERVETVRPHQPQPRSSPATPTTTATSTATSASSAASAWSSSGTPSASTTSPTRNVDSPYITPDHELYQPPVKTITWFHTGSPSTASGSSRSSSTSTFRRAFASRLRPGFVERGLPQPELDADRLADLSADEWREALRACKGMMLRQEVYELDVEALGARRPSTRRCGCSPPPTTTATSDALQPRGPNRHAVFLVTESEAITYHYELPL